MEESEGAGRTRVVVDDFVNASPEPLEMSFDAMPNKD